MAGVVCCVLSPVFGLGPLLRIVPVSLCCLRFSFVCVVLCLLWVGKCGGVCSCCVVCGVEWCVLLLCGVWCVVVEGRGGSVPLLFFLYCT